MCDLRGDPGHLRRHGPVGDELKSLLNEGGLDRFGGHSRTEFFQARLQLQFTKLSVATD